MKWPRSLYVSALFSRIKANLCLPDLGPSCGGAVAGPSSPAGAAARPGDGVPMANDLQLAQLMAQVDGFSI